MAFRAFLQKHNNEIGEFELDISLLLAVSNKIKAGKPIDDP